MHPMVKAVSTAVRKVSKLILRAQRDGQMSVVKKENGSYVTNVDVAVEQMLIDELKKIGYKDYFITEESGSFGNKESKYTWIIDPIDGTNNFVHGIPHNCISVALKNGNNIIMGIVYNPHLDQMFTAYKGRGATLDGKKIRVSQRAGFDKALFSASFKYSPKIFKGTYAVELFKLQREISGYRYSGSIALDLCYFASGYIDAIWIANNPNIWDIAAGYLIAVEAGGIITNFYAKSDIDSLDVFVGSNSKLQPKILKRLAKHYIQKA